MKQVGSGFASSALKELQSLVCYSRRKPGHFSPSYPNTDPDSFKGITGRLTRFNIRHGIKNVQLRGEILSSDFSAVEPFREESIHFIDPLTHTHMQQ